MPKRRYICGIDPGMQTGVAIYDRDELEFIHICTQDFISVQVYLAAMFGDQREIAIYVEVPPEFMYGRNAKKLRSTGNQRHLNETLLRAQGIDPDSLKTAPDVSEQVRDNAAFKIGGNRREGQLLVKQLCHLGFYAKGIPPIAEQKWTQEKFTLRTRLKTVTNQHERDAARIALYYK